MFSWRQNKNTWPWLWIYLSTLHWGKNQKKIVFLIVSAVNHSTCSFCSATFNQKFSTENETIKLIITNWKLFDRNIHENITQTGTTISVCKSWLRHVWFRAQNNKKYNRTMAMAIRTKVFTQFLHEFWVWRRAFRWSETVRTGNKCFYYRIYNALNNNIWGIEYLRLKWNKGSYSSEW